MAGRLQFATRREAETAASNLGISGTHSHKTGGKMIYMPGTNHSQLNRALKQNGMAPTAMPGDGMMDMSPTMGEMDGMEMADSAFSGRDVDTALIDDAGMFDEGAEEFRMVEDVSDPGFAGGGVDVEADMMGIDIGEQEALTDDLEGLFVGDEDKDGEMEIY